MSAHPLSQTAQFNAHARRQGWQLACDDTLTFDSPKLAALLAVWRAVTGARALPQRADFTARSLKPYLYDLTIIECLREAGGDRRYRFRLFGSGLARYSGDFTGKFLDEVIPAPLIASWYATYDLVLGTRLPLRFVSEFLALKLDHMTAESLVAPLCDASGVASALLTSVIYTPKSD